eukprot:8687713-Ditylum_brightwellii.AAC.1
MKQREDKKASREQQMLIVHMECKATEQAYTKRKTQRERHHQDFMMMMMMIMIMVTGAKSPVSSISSPSSFPSFNLVTPTKGAVTTGIIATVSTTLMAHSKEDELEKKCGRDGVA